MSYRVYRNNRSYRGTRQDYVDVNRNTDRQYYYYQQNQQYDDRNRYDNNDYDYSHDRDQHYYYNNHQMDNQRQRYPDRNQQNQYRQNQYRQQYQPQYQQRYQQPYQPRYESKYEREQKYQQKYQQKSQQKYQQKVEQKHEQKQEQKTKPSKMGKSAPKSWIEYDEEDEEEEINYNEISDDQQHEIKSCDSRSNLGDIDEYQHYNQPIDHQTIETQSNYSRSTYTTQRNLDRQRTQNIRDMNNWCKYVNITHSIREVYGKQNNTKINILDLGCGAGNDFMKCRGNKKYIKKFLGIDIDYDYIINARRKYFKSLQDGIKHKYATHEERKKFSLNNAYGQTVRDFYDEPMFDAQFICNDMTRKDLYKHPEIIAHKPFELINIQFALHFGFQTMNSVQALMKILETATKSGAYFICSFMRDEVIIKRLGQLMGDSIVDEDGVEFIEFKNEFQRIKMKKIDFQKIQEIYDEHKLFDEDIQEIYNEKLTVKDEEFCHGLVGIPYKYFQMDSVEGDDGDGDYEFFIGFSILCKLLWKYCKMRLVFKKTASDIYIESSRKFPYRYGYSKGRELNNVKWTNDEQQVIDTYAYALFQRV